MSFSFGGATSVAAPASSGFSFGGAAPAASSGFSFGGAASGAATSTAPAASSGFSFGGGSAAASATNSFGFGSATPAAPASGFSTGGFGAAPASSGFSTGGFGAAPASSGFSFSGGASPAAAAPSAFGGAAGTSSFGLFSGATAAPAAAPAPSAPAITLETVFEALPVDVQKNMGDFHAFLKDQDESDAFLKSVSPRQLEGLQQNLAQLEQDVLASRNVQDKQQTAVHAVRKDVRQLIHQVDTASLSLRSMDGSSASGNAYYSHIMRRVEMPSPYYWDLLEHFEAQMETIKRQIEDVEAQFLLQSNGNGSGSSSQFHPAQLQQILMAQNAALMQMAARVAEVHESAEEMRQLFLAKMRRDLERHGEQNPAAFKNPFDKRKKSAAADQDRRQAIDSIRFRTNVSPTIVSAAPQQQQQQPLQQQPSAFGFSASPAFGATATGTTGFGSFGATSTTAPASTGGFGFGAVVAVELAAPPATTSSGFGFGATTAAPKQVGFNLSANTVASPIATAGSPSFGFGAAPATPGGFGSISSSFTPGAPAAGSNKRSGRAQKKRS